MDNYISIILGLAKTIYINFKYFKFKDAIKLPILLSNKVKINSLNGKIIINNKVKTGMIKIGFGNIGLFDRNKSRTILEIKGKVIFEGNASIGHGSKIIVGKCGEVTFGDKFIIMAESSIVCFKNIEFGDGCLISWENLIMDTDFHKIYKDNKIINKDEKIIIGNNVWIGCRCTILKGSKVFDNSVIAANSVVTKKFNENNIIIGGNPAQIINSDIFWNH